MRLNKFKVAVGASFNIKASRLNVYKRTQVQLRSASAPCASYHRDVNDLGAQGSALVRVHEQQTAK